VLGEFTRFVSRRAAWFSDRAARYREQADRLDEIADSDNQPRSRARLLDLADQYRRLADTLMTKSADDEQIANGNAGFAPNANGKQSTIRAVAAVWPIY
jgi:hypothetical protein